MVSSDAIFGITQTDIGIANSATIITPSANADGTWPLDMTGYNDIFLAIKPTNGGNYAITAVMGPNTIPFGNLSPINAAATLRGATAIGSNNTENLYSDSSESMAGDVWNIIIISNILANQKVLQFSITNNSGGSSDIQTAFMRLV